MILSQRGKTKQTNKKQRGPEGTFRRNGYTYDADGNAGFTRIYLSPNTSFHISIIFSFLLKKKKRIAVSSVWADFRDFNLLPKEKEILLLLGEKNNNNNNETVPSGRHRVARMKLAVKLPAGAAVLRSLGWGGGFTSALPPLAVSRGLAFLTFWLFYHPASHNMTFLFPQSARSRREEDCLDGSTLSFFFFCKLVYLF